MTSSKKHRRLAITMALLFAWLVLVAIANNRAFKVPEKPKTTDAAISVLPVSHTVLPKPSAAKQKPPKKEAKPAAPNKAVVKKQRARDKVMTGFQATWYNNRGLSYTTKTGTRTKDGVTVGVDPDVIPLGSYIKIIFPDGRIYYRHAEDTGSLIKGKILDIYSSRSSYYLRKLGRVRHIKVIVMGRDHHGKGH